MGETRTRRRGKSGRRGESGRRGVEWGSRRGTKYESKVDKTASSKVVLAIRLQQSVLRGAVGWTRLLSGGLPHANPDFSRAFPHFLQSSSFQIPIC